MCVCVCESKRASERVSPPPEFEPEEPIFAKLRAVRANVQPQLRTVPVKDIGAAKHDSLTDHLAQILQTHRSCTCRKLWNAMESWLKITP